MSEKIAVVVVRGIRIGVNKPIKDTLHMLNLYDKHSCTILENNTSTKGMLRKVKDYITWGELLPETQKMLFEKKGQKYTSKTTDSKGKVDYSSRFFTHNDKKYKKYFRLSPPKGGWEKAGTKKPFSRSGALGYRKDKINELLQKMIR